MSSNRKSVAFSEDTKEISENGHVTVNGTSDDKNSAESHSTSDYSSLFPCNIYLPTNAFAASPNSTPKADPVDEVSELFKGLNKKKKSSKKKEEGAEEATPGADDFDPSKIKKKKKKAPKAAETDFEAKLAEVGVNENEEATPDDAAPAAAPEDEEEGDMIEGTGVWAHDAEKPIRYEKLLERFFAHLHSAHVGISLSDCFTSSNLLLSPTSKLAARKATLFLHRRLVFLRVCVMKTEILTNVQCLREGNKVQLSLL